MNSVNLIGRLVAEPELRYTPNGAAVVNARIAVNGAGAFISEKEGYQAGFFSIVVWGKQAESLADYCGKGREIAVSGRLSQRDWEGENGKVYVTEIIAERVDFLREVQEKTEDAPEAPKGNKGGSKGGAKGGKGGGSRGRQ